MLNKLCRLLDSFRLARALAPVAALAVALLVAGCGGQVDTAITVQPDGAWTGEMRLSISTGGPEGIAAAIEERAAALLDKQGIAHILAAGASEQDYTLALSGQDLAALGQLLSDIETAAAGLSGRVVVEISGQVQAGETLEVALPANLSTGYAWVVEPAGGAALAQVGEPDFRQVEPGVGRLARQAIRVQAGEGGEATLRLVYRRSWEADAAPSGVYTVSGAGTSLAAILAAISMPEPEPARQAPMPVSQAAAQPASATPDLPSYYNWCDLGGCTPIKNQGGCGSCWAFGTVGVIESAIKINDGLTKDLSEQYLVSCNTDGWSCDGGWWAHDYHQWKYTAPETTAGAVPEAEFPYVAWDAPCGGPYSHPDRLSSWGILSPEWDVAAVADIKQAIYDHGPVSVALCVGPAFDGYSGGIFSTEEAYACSPYAINHAVVLVGWNDAEQTWILRNSWGTGWGESGYMRIVWGTSNVGYRTSYINYVPAVPPDNWVYLPVVIKGYGQGGGECGLPIYEGFEGGVMPPAGWTRIQTNPRQTWKRAVYGTPYSGAYMADVEYDDELAQQDEWLLSPPFTASSARLQFHSYGSLEWCRDGYDNCDLNVWLVVGEVGGGDEIFVREVDGDWTATWEWSWTDIDLTPYLPAGTPVRVAFHYWGLDGAQVALDEIGITGACSGGCAFDSQFNGSADGWYSHSGTWYYDDNYLYTSGVANASSSASYDGHFGDFDYEVSMWRYGCDTCSNRILLRGTPDPLSVDYHWYSAYMFQYTRDGYYSIFKRVAGGAPVALVGWTYTSAINQGDAWNKLRVTANGTNLSFTINDNYVWSGLDSSLSSGRAGVGMYQDGSAGNELYVDWARLCLPLGSPPPGAPPPGGATVGGNEDQHFH